MTPLGSAPAGSAYLTVAVFNDHEHRGVLALHGPVQGLDAHAVLRGAEGQSPRVPNGPRWEIPGKLSVDEGEEKRGERCKKCKTERPQRPMLNYVCGDL